MLFQTNYHSLLWSRGHSLITVYGKDSLARVSEEVSLRSESSIQFSEESRNFENFQYGLVKLMYSTINQMVYLYSFFFVLGCLMIKQSCMCLLHLQHGQLFTHKQLWHRQHLQTLGLTKELYHIALLLECANSCFQVILLAYRKKRAMALINCYLDLLLFVSGVH